jgi:inositol transporter-like SP family MFS transporter
MRRYGRLVRVDRGGQPQATRGEEENPAVPHASWRGTILAALASYIDAGSIVAGAAGLALWADEYGLSTGAVGLIAAFSSNAISAGVGALAGGWLADRYGRVRVYRWDLLLYAFGLLWIIFATAPWMLVAGYVLTGLAVGADVPASWTLVTETAPAGRRGQRAGVAQLLWALGPIVVLLLALALSGLGVLGIRLVFAHLLVVALVLWVLRGRMEESTEWRSETSTARVTLAGVRELLSRRYLAPLLLLAGMYGIWNLKAGTSGFFMPYILRTVGAQSQAQALALQCAAFVIAMAITFGVFMRLIDRSSHARLYGAGIAFQIVTLLLLALLPLRPGVALTYVLLSGIGSGLGAQAFFPLWNTESFPARLRATALGVMFAVVRIGLGLWSLFVPGMALSTLAWVLTAFVLTSSVFGFAYLRVRRFTRTSDRREVADAAISVSQRLTTSRNEKPPGSPSPSSPTLAGSETPGRLA